MEKKELHSKSLVIIEDPNQIDKLIPLVRTKQGGDVEQTVIALDKDVCQELARKDQEFKTPEDYGLSGEYLEDKGLKWFTSFPNIKTKGNKNIKEIVTHDGLSVWWLVDETFYVSRFVFHSVREIIKQVILLDHIIKAEEPAMVYYAQNDTPTSIVIRFICKSRNIATATISRSSSIKRRLSQRLKAIAYVYGQWLRMFLREIYWMLLVQRYRSRKLRGKRKILIFSGPNWESVYDLATGEIRKGDPYFDSVIELLRGESEIVFVDIPTKGWGLGTMKEKKQQQKIICRPLEYYLNIGVILKALKASRKLHRDYQLLTMSNSFRQSLNLHNMPLYDLVGQNLSFFFSRACLTMVVAIVEIVKRMVEIENPHAILMGDAAIYERAIIAAAKSKGIPTVVAMHGVMSPYRPHFNRTSEDIGPDREATAPYCPISDKIIVYGNDDKDNMVRRAGFAEGDVIAGSQPRYDVLAKAEGLFDREKIFSRLNLDPGKKLITWMTQSHGFTPQENERNINAVYNAVKSVKDVQLVIKLHPAENQKAPLYRKDESFKPTIVGGWGTLTFELLYASDIVITRYSTTAIEALMLNKPVIVIEFTSRPIPVVYVEAGAALYIDKEDALAPAIEGILHDEEARQRLAKAREKFVSEGNYKPDGQASQRVADLVIEMIEESKRGKSSGA